MAYKYINEPGPTPVHPRIRAWDQWRQAPGITAVEVEVRREREGLVVGPARLFVSFLRKDTVEKLDETEWDLELDQWLVSVARAKGPHLASEKIRFSLWLRAHFLSALRRYGDGYFSAVLLDLVREDFAKVPEVAEVLGQIHKYAEVSSSAALQDCRLDIQGALGMVGAAIASLHDADHAWDILGGALARYLDERFSVTNRKLLGFE
jgi:hypothetical protein